MKKLLFFFIVPLLLLISSNPTSAQMPDSVRTYIDTALYFMQTKALNAKGLDWDSISDSVYKQARNAQNYNEAFPAIVYAFRQLKDYHGMVATQDTFYRYPSPINFQEILSAGIKKEFLKGNRVVTDFLPGSVAYLRVPAMNINKQAQVDDRANKLRDSLCMLISKHPKALLLDLRMNAGGNAAPMQSGIGPLFRDSVLGYGVDRDGNFLSPVMLRDGVTVDEGNNKTVNINNTCQVNPGMPIAVLIGPSTVSSGEILAAYLKQQSNVKLFGEPTPGYCNATEGFLFRKNQGYLLLTVNKIADAKKKIYNEMLVKPDVYIKSDDNYDNLAMEPTVKAALQWVRQGSTKEP
jgi:carboxyl-terminal processing protease